MPGERRGRPPAGKGGHVGNLVGAGPSIVGVSGALRARDAARPTQEHVAEAERTLVIRRRPPEAEKAPTPKPQPPRTS